MAALSPRLNLKKGSIKMAMKESHKLAIRRLKTSFPSLSEGIVASALRNGMTEKQIRNMLKAAGPDKKVSAAVSSVKGALDKPPAKTTTPPKNTGGQRATDALASIKTALAKPTDRGGRNNRSTSAGGRTAKEAASANMAPPKASPKKDAPKAKNFNVGVSKGGVPFKEAFAHFRKKGNKTFTWNGKKYTTKLKKDK